MKFKKSTQILFASALILATGIAVYEGTIAPDRQAAQLQQQQVFDFEIDRVVALTLETPDRTLKFDRLPAEDEETTAEPRWQFQAIAASDESEIQKAPVLAKDAYVLFLLDALIDARSDRILTVTDSELGEFGLEEPKAKIEVRLDDETTARIQLGNRDFSESFVYAIADSKPASQTEATTESTTESTDDISVLLVSTNLENGVNRSLSEWQADEEEPQNPEASETKPADVTSEGEATPNSDSPPDSAKTEATENIEEPQETQPTETQPTEATSETETVPESIPNSETPIAPENPIDTPPAETTEPPPESEASETVEPSEVEESGE